MGGNVGVGTLTPSEILSVTGNVGITGEIALSSHLDMPDDAKIKIGTGDDLEIYHNADHSVISDVGTGNLQIRCEDFRLTDSSNSQYVIHGDVDGVLTLYHNGSSKLTTNSGGVGITGDLTLSLIHI